LETEEECSDKYARRRGPAEDSLEDSSTDEGELAESALERKRLKKLYPSGKPWCRKLNMFAPPQPLKLKSWLDTFKGWSNSERLVALDNLIDSCEAPQVRHMMQVIEPQFQRDFISLLPKEVIMISYIQFYCQTYKAYLLSQIKSKISFFPFFSMVWPLSKAFFYLTVGSTRT
jgi:hypothetical protein